MKARIRAVSVFTLLLFFAACSTSAWLVSGKALDEVGQQFLATGAMYDSMLKSKAVSAEEYRAWAAFANHFKAVYPSVVATWKQAQTAQQASDSVDAILALKNELLGFYLAAQAKKAAKPTIP